MMYFHFWVRGIKTHTALSSIELNYKTPTKYMDSYLKTLRSRYQLVYWGRTLEFKVLLNQT